MASSLSSVKTSALRPANRETIFCKTLVVGNTVAAYTATLAILQAGGQVCWVLTGKLDIKEYFSQEATSPAASAFSWSLGRRVSPWATAVIMSQSQQAFWANWQPAIAPSNAASGPAGITVATTQAETQSRQAQWRQAIAPYLHNHQLILITQGKPVRVLYSENRGQRKVYQVVFREPSTGWSFQVQAKLTLDATRNAALQQSLAGTPGKLPPPEFRLMAEHLPTTPREARGTFFEDAIALVMVPTVPHRQRLYPVSIPLKALIPEKTEGFLGVSYPGCEAGLRARFQHPRAQWALGEAAGQVAAVAAQAGGVHPLMQQSQWAWKLQQKLVRQGIPIFAFDDVPLDDPDFEAIQMMAIANVVRTMRQRDLSFRPETPVTRAVVASALARLLSQKQLPPAPQAEPDLTDVTPNHWAVNAIQQTLALNLMAPDTTAHFAPSKVLSKCQLAAILRPFYPLSVSPCPFPEDETPARRRHLSRALYPIWKARWSR